MPFTSALVARQTGDLDWVVVEPLTYQGKREEFVVPPGATTDFASIPDAFQWLLPRSGRYTRAAVLHDYLWRNHATVGIPRSDADGIFRRSMQELGVPFLRRWLMWGAVRWASLVRSRLRDGARDLPRLLLVTLLPGLPVAVGGLVVLVMLFAFWLLEALVGAALWTLRRLRIVRAHSKPVNAPKVTWTP
jgi:hypothetical protein